MIRVQWFSNKNSWRNLWGLLGDVQKSANEFMERHGARGTNGINVGPTGVYITYEDGEFSKSVERDVLNTQLIKNMTEWTNRNISLRSLKRKDEETTTRLEYIEKELTDLTGDLKDGTEEYKVIKPQLDELRAEKDYLNNVVKKNIATQFPQVKNDMDRLEYENDEIRMMISETYY